MNFQFLFILILFGKILSAQISITVLNKEFIPIANVSIFCDTLIVGKTNNEGFYNLEQNTCKYFIISCIGYKTKKIIRDSIKQNCTIILEDSIFMLKEFAFKDLKTETLEIGSKLSNNYRWGYRIKVGGLMGSKIPIRKENYKIEEINFFVADYKLPDTVSFVEVRVCSCPATYDTMNRMHYLYSQIVKLDKKKSWYRIKYPLHEQTYISTNCIFVEFKIVYHPVIDEFMKNSIEIQKNNYIYFGLDNKPNKIITYTYSGTLLSFNSYNFRPEWHKIHQSQKLMLKIVAMKNP
ncbi:MAG: hypothetical protein ACK4K9_06690 [Bacteroidia bacterium]